jgi:MraZ protein
VGCYGAFWGTAGSHMASPGKPFYTGLFRHTLDDKNRLTIPSAWRAAHEKDATFLAMPNPDGYVSVLPPAEVEKLYEKIAAVPLSDASAQAEIAAFFAIAQAFSFDAQGRIALNEALMRHAGLAKDVVLNGGFTKFNLYSPQRWSAVEQKSSSASQADFMRRFGI